MNKFTLKFVVHFLVLFQSLAVSLRHSFAIVALKVVDELEDIDYGIDDIIEDLVFSDLEVQDA